MCMVLQCLWCRESGVMWVLCVVLQCLWCREGGSVVWVLCFRKHYGVGGSVVLKWYCCVSVGSVVMVFMCCWRYCAAVMVYRLG